MTHYVDMERQQALCGARRAVGGGWEPKDIGATESTEVDCSECLEELAKRTEVLIDPEGAIKEAVAGSLHSYVGVSAETAVPLVKQRIRDVLAAMMPRRPLTDVRVGQARQYGGPGAKLVSVDIQIMEEQSYGPLPDDPAEMVTIVRHEGKTIQVLVDLEELGVR